MNTIEATETTAPAKLGIVRNTKAMRKFKSPVHDHFEALSETRSRCKLCMLTFFKRTSNFKRHLHSVHGDVYNQTCPAATNVGRSTQKDMKAIKVQMSKLKLVRSCIGLVAEENQPFFFLDSPIMQALTNPLAVGMTSTTAESMFRFNSTNIRPLMMKVASSIRAAIKRELDQKMVSVKVDLVSRHQRTMRGVSVQFAEDGVVRSHTLAVTELEEDECDLTANQADIINTLKRYNVKMEQVVNIALDTGENMLENKTEDENFADGVTEENSADYEANLKKYMEVQNVQWISTIQVDRCPAHLVQLCACDLTYNREIWDMILNCRIVTKNIRETLNGTEVMSLKKIQPVLDSGACWLSTYQMISCIKDCRTELPSIFPYVLDVGDTPLAHPVSIHSDYWEFVDAYTVLLQPVYKSLLKYQSENLNYNDFYEAWMQMRLKIESQFKSYQNGGKYFKIISETLIASIEVREKQLLRQPTCLSALYLDPRFNSSLDLQQKHTAKTFLINIWDKFCSLKSPASAVAQTMNSNSNQGEKEEEEEVPPETSSEQTADDVLDSFLKIQRQKYDQLKKPAAHYEIENLFLPPVKRNINVVEYWDREKYNMFTIFTLFQIVRAFSATQVTVKRVLDCFEVKAADDEECGESFLGTLDAVLMVKMNSSFLDSCLVKLMADD